MPRRWYRLAFAENRKLCLLVICYSLLGTGVTKALAVNVFVRMCECVRARSVDVVQAKAICYQSQLAFSEPLLIILPMAYFLVWFAITSQY